MYQHPIYETLRHPLLPLDRALNLADDHFTLKGFRPYDVGLSVSLAAQGLREVTVSLPHSPAYIVRLAASSDSAEGFSVSLADSTGESFGSAPLPSGLAGVAALPAPLQGFAAYGQMERPRIVPDAWLRVVIRSAAAVAQEAKVLLSFLVPDSGEMPAWVRNELERATSAIVEAPLSGGLLTQVEYLPLNFSAVGDNVILPALDRVQGVAALDLYTGDTSDFALYAGTPGAGLSNRLLVARKAQFSGSIVYPQSTGVDHFLLRSGEAFILNQSAPGGAWAGAVQYRLL